MKHYALLGILALATACGSSDDSSEGDRCFSNSDCSGDACFLGSCVGSGFGISVVTIDIRPPRSSASLRQRVIQVVDTSAGASNIQLAETLTVAGSVTRDGQPIEGTVSARLIEDGVCQPTVTDEALTYTADVERRGLALAAIPGFYRVNFTPNDALLPPLTLPADNSCGVVLSDSTRLDLAYATTLPRLSGRLRYSGNDTTGVAGAAIVATVVDANGLRWDSSSIETGPDGSFSVALPVDGDAYSVTVRPGSNTNVPVTKFDVVRDNDGRVGDLSLGVSAPIPLQVSVVTSTGEPVSNVTVTATGSIGNGLLTVSGATATAGTATLNLRSGVFAVVAAPRSSNASGIAGTSVTVTENSAPRIVITLPAKATVAGVVRTSDGLPLANARVTFRLTTTTTTSDREATVTSGPDGAYSVLVDATSATGTAAEHEVTVDPPADSRAPRVRELLRVDNASIQRDITLFPPTFFYGTIIDADALPVPAAALLFYSNIFGGNLLVGVTQSDTRGEFAVALPQLNQ